MREVVVTALTRVHLVPPVEYGGFDTVSGAGKDLRRREKRKREKKKSLTKNRDLDQNRHIEKMRCTWTENDVTLCSLVSPG